MSEGTDIDPGTSRAAYWRETAPLLRQRLGLAMALFAFFMGIGTFVEMTYYPARSSFSLLMYLVEAVVGLGGAAACWIPGMRERGRAIAAAVAIALAVCICLYHGAVGAEAERVATVLGCVLNLYSVLLPWGWPAQAAAAFGTLGAFALASPYLTTNDAHLIPGIVLLASATTSVWCAFFLDRYRHETFRRTALQTDEAEIAAALAHVGATLSQHLGRPDMLEQVNRLAIETIGCNWSSLFLFDEKRRVFWLGANVGSRPEVRAGVAQLEFAPESLPLWTELKPGTLVEIPEVSQQTLLPPELLRHIDMASGIFAPIARGDHIIGVLINGWVTRTGPFSSRETRLTLGIAHATAIALENGRLVADLQAADRLKSEFVATMSHELRTPLNVIMGYTEMLADGLVDPHDTAAYGETIKRIQQRSIELLDLVTQTLDMGRLEAGRDVPELAPMDAARLLGELARELEPYKLPAVALVWRNELGTEPLVTDRAKLKTILKNLIGNALKFTSAGSVEVVATRDAHATTFTVRDTGIGIDTDHLPLIFEMFRQVDSSATRRFGGVGLGLHIAQRLADRLGGTIEVASTLGEGSIFTVTLPVRTMAPTHPPLVEAAPGAQSLVGSTTSPTATQHARLEPRQEQ